MNLLRKSWGKFCLLSVGLALTGLTTAGLTGCASGFQVSDIEKKPAVAPQLTPPILAPDKLTYETSLTEDKNKIEDLRKDIPIEKRNDNDELREILSYMGEVSEPPRKIRDKFYRITQRVRSTHRKEVQRIRANFNKDEKSYRDQFYTKLKNEREDFLRRKVSREERKIFFDEQDARRREYAADERDRRHQFTSDLKSKEDDFNHAMREKINEFNQVHRVYSQKYDEQIKYLKNKNNKAD